MLNDYTPGPVTVRGVVGAVLIVAVLYTLALLTGISEVPW